MNIPLSSITKLKIKAESSLRGTKLLKISAGSNDFFFSVRAQDQLQWTLALIYQKMITMGQGPPQKGQTYTGVVEG
jgi:hypothetical protein